MNRLLAGLWLVLLAGCAALGPPHPPAEPAQPKLTPKQEWELQHCGRADSGPLEGFIVCKGEPPAEGPPAPPPARVEPPQAHASFFERHFTAIAIATPLAAGVISALALKHTNNNNSNSGTFSPYYITDPGLCNAAGYTWEPGGPISKGTCVDTKPHRGFWLGFKHTF
jgi:hypothetical protein